jgi:hypothetical protein
MLGASGHPYLFIDDRFVAALRNSNYVKVEASPGKVSISATVADTSHDRGYGYLRQYLPPDFSMPKCEGNPRKATCIWDDNAKSPDKEDHGCGRVDWRHVEIAQKEDLELCRVELINTSASLDTWLHPHTKAEALLLGMVVPGSAGAVILANGINMPTGNRSWLRMCGVKTLPKPSSPEGKELFTTCQSKVAAALRLTSLKDSLPIKAEGGKTYYVKWSVSRSGGKLELVDAIKGSHDLSGLHLAKN